MNAHIKAAQMSPEREGTQVSTPATHPHEHTCRRCGDGFECFGRDTSLGCEDFNGYCQSCDRDIAEEDSRD